MDIFKWLVGKPVKAERKARPRTELDMMSQPLFQPLCEPDILPSKSGEEIRLIEPVVNDQVPFKLPVSLDIATPGPSSDVSQPVVTADDEGPVTREVPFNEHRAPSVSYSEYSLP